MPEFETKVQELNQLGENLLKAGNADAAYEYFQQAEQADPNCITSYLNQAKVLISTDALKEAQEALNKALLLDAQNAEALFHMANVCFLSDLYEQGLLYAGQALEAGCNEVMLYQNMALAHEKLGHLDNALRFYSKAINLNPLDGSTYVAKAECQMRNHRDDDALQTLSMLHQNCPDSFEAYHYSYIIYARKREYDKAQEVLSRGIEDFPSEVEFYIDMIHLLNINRQPKEALELLDAWMRSRTPSISMSVTSNWNAPRHTSAPSVCLKVKSFCRRSSLCPVRPTLRPTICWPTAAWPTTILLRCTALPKSWCRATTTASSAAPPTIMPP